MSGAVAGTLLRNHWDLNPGDVPHLSKCQKTKKKKRFGRHVGADIVPFFFLVLFLFLWFSGIWRGEVHLKNWDLNDLLGNEMDTKCLIRNFHTCPKTQRSQRSFLDNYPKRDLQKISTYDLSFMIHQLPEKMAPKQSMNLPTNHQSGYAAPPHVGCAAGLHRGCGDVCLVATKAHLGDFEHLVIYGDEYGDYPLVN